MIDVFQRKKVVFSIEIFPPKDDYGFSTILNVLPAFAEIQPDFISVTCGAGGTGGTRTQEIAQIVQGKFGIPSMAHLTCVSTSFAEIDATLARLKDSGITNILALRGDKKAGMSINSDFVYATDLIEYINKKGGFEVSAACYPEGHPESINFTYDGYVLKKKYDLGVRHFVSQLFFDNDDYYSMRDSAAALSMDGAYFEAGIMPITNAKQISRIVSLSGAKIPTRLAKLFSRFEGKPEALFQAGINYALEQITELIAGGVHGIHLYAMNNAAVANEISRNICSIISNVN